jgi:hypothetical protein
MFGRGEEAVRAYLNANRADREEMVSMSLCDDNCAFGLAAGYQAYDQERLAGIRNTPAATRALRLRRKMNFYHVLTQMAERSERVAKYRDTIRF